MLANYERDPRVSFECLGLIFMDREPNAQTFRDIVKNGSRADGAYCILNDDNPAPQGYTAYELEDYATNVLNSYVLGRHTKFKIAICHAPEGTYENVEGFTCVCPDINHTPNDKDVIILLNQSENGIVMQYSYSKSSMLEKHVVYKLASPALADYYYRTHQ